MKHEVGESSKNAHEDESGEHFRVLIKKLEAAENDSRAGKSRPLRKAMADIRTACRQGVDRRGNLTQF